MIDRVVLHRSLWMSEHHSGSDQGAPPGHDQATVSAIAGDADSLALHARSASASHGRGERIGNYRILEVIGEGGFGVVYLAEQEKPVRRRVALKILKLGMDTHATIARFEAERQALAMMD